MAMQFKPSFIYYLILAAILFQSCGNVDIVKRRYRPGFHIDVSKKKDRQNTSNTKAFKADKVDEHLTELITKEPKKIALLEIEDKLQNQSIPSFEATINSKPQLSKSKFNDFMLTPVREIKREKLNSGLPRAVF